MAADSGVVHDSASLLRFVESITKLCDLRPDYPAYLSASRDFLGLIQNLAQKTREYLSAFPSRAPTDRRKFPVYRQELFTLREAWSEIHRRVKPMADADTLHVPSALINALVRRLQTVGRFKESRVAVLHTEWLNYLQVVASRIRNTIDDISAIVGSERFDRNLGLIGIPYSQSQSVFLNSLIAHEIGHFVFGELSLGSALSIQAREILKNVFTPVASSLTPDDRKRMPTLFAGWTEEIFCDLFAVRLIGPCYSYAYIEIFDLTNMLHSHGTLNRAAAAASLVFSDSHPSDLYRIRKQTGLLRKLGWWAEIRSSQSNARRILEHSANLRSGDFMVPSLKRVEKEALDALEQIAVKIAAAVEDALAGLDCGIDEYIRLSSTVKEYLLHGVVPSSVPDPSLGSRKAPDVVTILNASYQLYLDDLPALMKKIQNQDPSSVIHRTEWSRRLESWALKALDDLELMSIRSSTVT
jgi:hypothetical protein